MSQLSSHFEKQAALLRDCATLEVSERERATTHRLVPHAPGAVGVVMYLGRGGCVEVRGSNHEPRTWNNALPWPGWRRRAERIDYVPYR